MKTKRTDSLKGYKIDFTNNTLVMNLKFSNAAMNDFGSKEYLRMKDILDDFPGLKIVIQKGRDIKTARPTKRLTYKNMELYIKTFENSNELLKAFKHAKELSKPLASPYAYVRDWFETQFPNYNVLPSEMAKKGTQDDKGQKQNESSENHSPAPANPPDPDKYKKKNSTKKGDA